MILLHTILFRTRVQERSFPQVHVRGRNRHSIFFDAEIRPGEHPHMRGWIFALLASVTRQELARQVACLKKENKILRSRLPQRLVATPQEKRRLLKFGRNWVFNCGI